ncbi:MAG: class I SAM-dependent methyltransferase [Candidatus Izemoplasmatales bacterium]
MKNSATYAHELLSILDLSNDITVDMTVGRGQDTVFLSKVSKGVIGFDIQEEAIQETKKRLDELHIENVKLIHDSHHLIRQYIKNEIGCMIYNLGYLPHGDKDILTQGSTTIESLKEGLPLLKKGGRCVITVYQKHPGNEATLLQHFTSNLSSKEYDVTKWSILNKELAPYIIIIDKL